MVGGGGERKSKRYTEQLCRCCLPFQATKKEKSQSKSNSLGAFFCSDIFFFRFFKETTHVWCGVVLGATHKSRQAQTCSLREKRGDGQGASEVREERRWRVGTTCCWLASGSYRIDTLTERQQLEPSLLPKIFGIWSTNHHHHCLFFSIRPAEVRFVHVDSSFIARARTYLYSNS